MRYRTSIAAMLLSSALAVPAVAMAGQDRDHREDRNEAKHERRVYDRAHHDYHVWDGREDQMYRQYAEEHRLGDRGYARLSAKQQREYWKWRHEHERDHDRR